MLRVPEGLYREWREWEEEERGTALGPETNVEGVGRREEGGRSCKWKGNGGEREGKRGRGRQ